MAKMNYDAINFKNKDVDKFATKFGNPLTPAQKDSLVASRGMTPVGDGSGVSYMPKSKAEISANKQSARQSNPAKGINVDSSVAMKIRKKTMDAAEEALKPKPNLPKIK